MRPIGGLVVTPPVAGRISEPNFQGSRRLWSLWDMREHYAERWYALACLMGNMITAAEKRDPGDPVKEGFVIDQLGAIKELCEASNLRVSLYLINNLLVYHREMKPSLLYSIFLTELQALKNAIGAELSTFVFFKINDEYAPYFKQKSPFGIEVDTNFSRASLDIEEAAKCLALSRPTASVFHVMRVMEVGLKAIGNELDIPYAPSWESYISQITAKISEKRPKKSIDWIKDEPFFRDVLGDLQSIKIAWRNPTMHIVRNYNSDEAEDIFRAARTFMKRLATRLSQVSEDEKRA
jgi:hypothetical protein